jgi:serine/threonine-protein kinase
MVLSDGSVKLMDLELAGLRDAPPMRLAPAPNETPPSPVERPDEPITEKTDIYAFASIVYEMLCGAPPFAASGAAPAKQRPPRPAWPRDRREKIPGSVRRIIEDALSEDPQRRPFMSQLLNALVLKPSSTVGSRRRIAIVGAAAVATVGAGALGWGLVTLRTSVIDGPAYSTPSVASTPVETNRSAGAPAVGATASPPHETAPPTVSAPTSVSAPPPAVAAPTAVTPPAMTVPAPARGTTPPPASRTVSTPRRERTPARQAPASPGHESARAPSDAPAAPTHRPVSTADDGYDPAAVIDWVLSDGRR